MSNRAGDQGRSENRQKPASIRIVAISDTHGQHERLTIPNGDLLIHAGDLTAGGRLEEIQAFNEFLGGLPHRHKLIIAGNHDFCLEEEPARGRELLTNCIYLQDEAVHIDGICFYGSPWQPRFGDWAFNLSRGPEIRAKWEQIPRDTDVLITHGPPLGYLDRTLGGLQVGCRGLLEVVEEIKPRLHVFGHIHEGAGIKHSAHTAYLNASSCDAYFQSVNPLLVYDYSP